MGWEPVLGLPVQSGWPTRVNLQNRDFDICRRNFRAGDMRQACTLQGLPTVGHHLSVCRAKRGISCVLSVLVSCGVPLLGGYTHE